MISIVEYGNTRRQDTLLKYFDFMMILERILAFKPPVRQRTIIWVFGYLVISGQNKSK